MSDDRQPPTPVDRAKALGHTVQDDPPHGLSRIRRWTCTQCGSAVLANGSVVYGSAVEGPCADSPQFEPVEVPAAAQEAGR